MTISKFFGGLRTLTEIKEKPLEALLDLILGTIASAFIPIPFIGAIIAKYKHIILWMLGGLLVSGVILVFAIVTTLFAPFLFLNGGEQGTERSGLAGLQGSMLLEALVGYREEGFTDTDLPNRDPLGGEGFTNAIITFDYHQSGYAFFDGIHKGVDFYPSQAYFASNQAYAKTGQIIIFATLNGTGAYYIDAYGSHTVEIINAVGTMKSINMHLATSFISTGQQVQAGQPIGVMGSSGESTGVHLHYELRVQQGGDFIPVDPKGFIH